VKGKCGCSCVCVCVWAHPLTHTHPPARVISTNVSQRHPGTRHVDHCASARDWSLPTWADSSDAKEPRPKVHRCHTGTVCPVPNEHTPPTDKHVLRCTTCCVANDVLPFEVGLTAGGYSPSPANTRTVHWHQTVLHDGHTDIDHRTHC
jgi:hypothetical protein